MRLIRVFVRPGKSKKMAPCQVTQTSALVAHWKQLVSSGLPILVCKSGEPAALGSSELRAGTFDYLEHITSFAGHKSRLSLQMIEGTNHSFADRVGREAIREHAEAWLHKHFPGEVGGDSAP